MPDAALKLVTAWALACLLYSLTCALALQSRYRAFLRLLVAANAGYCALALGLVARHWPALTPVGAAYFVAEALLVVGVAVVERAVLQRLPRNA